MIAAEPRSPDYFWAAGFWFFGEAITCLVQTPGNAMIERAKHIRSNFDAALYGLKNDVLMMSSLTDRIFQTAFEALLKRDTEQGKGVSQQILTKSIGL
ncbi:MAG: hypothetical protein JO170_02720 [Verrucomicrobia bacterium]|nr:hypothetical protein [Verrucomicrobiota bacterium]